MINLMSKICELFLCHFSDVVSMFVYVIYSKYLIIAEENLSAFEEENEFYDQLFLFDN